MWLIVSGQVDYTGFTTINVQRFGQKFVGKVANPQELLLFSKAVARAAKPEAGVPCISASVHE